MNSRLTPEGAKKKAWKAFAAFIRARDPFCVTCLVSGKNNPTTEAGHFLHNSDKKNQQLGGNELWYDEQNVNGQCGHCNRWMSGNGSKYALYIEERYGEGTIQVLYKKFRTVRKYTMEELLEIEREYNAR